MKLFLKTLREFGLWAGAVVVSALLIIAIFVLGRAIWEMLRVFVFNI